MKQSTEVEHKGRDREQEKKNPDFRIKVIKNQKQRKKKSRLQN